MVHFRVEDDEVEAAHIEHTSFRTRVSDQPDEELILDLVSYAQLYITN